MCTESHIELINLSSWRRTNCVSWHKSKRRKRSSVDARFKSLRWISAEGRVTDDLWPRSTTSFAAQKKRRQPTLDWMENCVSIALILIPISHFSVCCFPFLVIIRHDCRWRRIISNNIKRTYSRIRRRTQSQTRSGASRREKRLNVFLIYIMNGTSEKSFFWLWVFCSSSGESVGKNISSFDHTGEVKSYQKEKRKSVFLAKFLTSRLLEHLKKSFWECIFALQNKNKNKK